METRPWSAWLQVISQMEEVLAKTLERWGEPAIPAPAASPQPLSPEGRGASFAPLPSGERGWGEAAGSVTGTALQNIDQRFERIRTCLELAGRQTAEVETQLAAESRAVEDWLQAVADLRPRLESCANVEAEASE